MKAIGDFEIDTTRDVTSDVAAFESVSLGEYDVVLCLWRLKRDRSVVRTDNPSYVYAGSSPRGPLAPLPLSAAQIRAERAHLAGFARA